MFSSKQTSILVSVILIALIVLTRTNHFGDSVYLPDATLAVMFLGGLLVASPRWAILAIVAAFGMDAYALGPKGVSDYCMSLGYWGLIPTYLLVWGAGRLLANRKQPFAITAYAVYGWAATSLAFVLSNMFWYMYSDKIATMSIVEFAQHVAVYYTPYVGYAMMYLGVAWALSRVFSSKLVAYNARQV